MSEDRKTYFEFDNLPKEFVNRLTRPFTQFLPIEAASGAFLFLFAVIALVVSNSPWAHYFFDFREADVGFQWGSFNPSQFNDAKLGILLASVFSAVAGITLLSRCSIIEDKVLNPL